MADKHDLVGKQLGDYLIKDKLATGGMSYVFVGEDVSLGRRAAVKVLTPDITEDDESLPDRFKREARAVAQLEHDNIIPIYQFGELDGIYFLAMRFIDGHDFADEITEAKRAGKLFDVKRSLDVLEQVASALDYAHANGIVHRDIKPSNVLIDNNGKAILTDFGLVLWSSVDKTLGTAFGTPRYISPEQATDSQAAVAQSDIYSLAVIFYEIVTGKMLFTGQTPMEMAISHITEKPTPPRKHNPNIPVQVEREILKSLDKEPSNRHQTAMEFIRSLRKAYDDAGGIDNVATDTREKRQELLKQEIPPVTPKLTPQVIADGDTIPAPTPIIDAPDANKIRGAKPATVRDKAPKPAPGGNRSRMMMLGGIGIAIVIVLFLSALIAGGGLLTPPLPTISSIGDTTEEATPDDNAILAATDEATDEPTEAPTDAPTDEPTEIPTDAPTDEPTDVPTETDTPEPTITPTITPSATPYPILDELPDGVLVSLVYNPTILVIRNDSEGSVVFNDMSMTGLMDEGEGGFNASNLPRVAMLPGECIVIRAETEPVPTDWGCRNERSSQLLQSDNRFWFADSADDVSFAVFWRNNEIKTCNTVGRAVGNVNGFSCMLEWPVVADG